MGPNSKTEATKSKQCHEQTERHRTLTKTIAHTRYTYFFSDTKPNSDWKSENQLTLLSRSNSVLSHSKSLYRLRTDDSFKVKIGRFVWIHKKRQVTHKGVVLDVIAPRGGSGVKLPRIRSHDLKYLTAGMRWTKETQKGARAFYLNVRTILLRFEYVSTL